MPLLSMKPLSRLLSLILYEIFFRSWWVVLFILLCYLCYEQGVRKHDRDFIQLRTQFVMLHQEFSNFVAIQERLQGEKRSFDDPAWIERVLMEELGLTPQGQTKIIFSDD